LRVGIVLILFGQWVVALVLWGVDLLICNNIDLVLQPYITSKEIRRVHQAILLNFRCNPPSVSWGASQILGRAASPCRR